MLFGTSVHMFRSNPHLGIRLSGLFFQKVEHSSFSASERIFFERSQEVQKAKTTTSFVDDDFVYQNAPETQNALYDTTVNRETMDLPNAKYSRLGQPIRRNEQEDILKPMNKAKADDRSELTSVPRIQLPFDDARKAEDVLEMDIDGKIDETWQDSRAACIEDVDLLVECLKKNKAWDVTVVNAQNKKSVFDFLIFASCHGTRHINLVSWAVQELDRFTNTAKMNRILQETDWEPITVGRIVVNLMTEQFRAKAKFERKWVLTSSMDPLDFCHHAISEGRGIASHGLWSLTLNLQDLEDFENDYCRETLLRQY